VAYVVAVKQLRRCINESFYPACRSSSLCSKLGVELRIVRIHIENFRGISLADLHFNGTSVFLGDNNTGKSTVFEAIELAIGADRLSRTQAIDEHDFHGGRYLAEGGQPQPKIIIEVVIAGLDEQHCTKFRMSWNFGVRRTERC
jgi:putative ATP-dependent endonuclease of OLD family